MKEKAALESRVANRRAPLPAMHPKLAQVYRAKVATLQEAMTASPTMPGCWSTCATWSTVSTLAPARSAISRKSLLTGGLAAMLNLTMSESTALAASGHDLFLSSVKVVAGEDLNPFTMSAFGRFIHHAEWRIWARTGMSAVGRSRPEDCPLTGTESEKPCEGKFTSGRFGAQINIQPLRPTRKSSLFAILSKLALSVNIAASLL